MPAVDGEDKSKLVLRQGHMVSSKTLEFLSSNSLRQKFFDLCWHVLLFSHLRGKVSIHRPLRAMHYCFGPHETNFLLLPTPCWVLSRLRLSQIHWARPLMQRFLLSCWQCSLCGLLNENVSLSSHQLCAQIPKLIYRYYFFYPPWVLRAELSKQSFSEIPVSI